MSVQTGRKDSAAKGCPVHAGEGAALSAPNGCPVSHRAAAFDPFEAPYQVDPADALRWSRAQEPVFYSPKLGYWVVSRYDDIKAVFRDNILFSPRIALEKITPVTQEATDTLKQYDYAMNRTLVNEDEPAHMERRRALLDHFLPENLCVKEDMVRRLTREKVDGIIDTGRADLVDEMLWEIPLTVALHFLGVPEEDMDTLRRYSIAHTVNTWGRPSPEEQVAVAHAVGNFWQYAGKVLEKMRAEPDGPGWMHYAIRKNKEIPEVVTDSYLHSMMMAIIVAAHETTAHASANALKLLLTHRQAWEDICTDPSLIPNTVEECLRYAGSVVAWRRQAMADTQIGGVPIPEGAKLLIVTASANHDSRHFEAADTFDIYRDNAVDHLTFGYGSHQCMGKNLARMEMRIFLEEFTRRLPHMRLAEQEFTYLPNTSFRGPDHLWVEWDPQENPERCDGNLLKPRASFAVGAPSKKDIVRKVRIAEVRQEAEGVLGLTLEDVQGRPLPAWSAGAHVELVCGEYERRYSLCGHADANTFSVAVLREDQGRGGSRFIHEAARNGMVLNLRGPRNHFRINEDAPRHLLIAGGIGITPIIAMADRLKALGHDYEVHYAGRSRATMAFIERLERDHVGHVSLYPADEGRRADLSALATGRGEGTQIYVCGPERMIEHLQAVTQNLPEDALRFEHFSHDGALLDPERESPFDVELTDSGLNVRVPADQTLLQALRAAGIDVPSDCEEGLCGTCEVAVREGGIDHRDKVLTSAEQAGNDRMMSCCSRALGGCRLKVAL
ncbi:cytochrome P450/oxidoreductase [Chelativorans sp. YIM 93263]|uniref:cytochrome P450/oxidoreductase n=1 Tax=Chelativorans sp. YIM 93263 TaxID=2906648 RepID=UPI00237873F7|nr:cytochrome P450/oxidoreductase [Chelativorans sp. YIM 93263]